MTDLTIQSDSLIFWKSFSLQFQRTLRIPDDGHIYPLPPGLGAFPICKVDDYPNDVPTSWLKHGGVFIPMYQSEALWMNFHSRSHKPNALKVAVGKINAVSGKPWQQKLLKSEADYLVVPPQPWLDGINAGNGFIKQFVAMPLGMGYTVEGQVTGKEEFGGIQIIVYEPKPDKKFPKPEYELCRDKPMAANMAMPKGSTSRRKATKKKKAGEMGIAAGGKMKQKIYEDPHGIDTWDEDNYRRVYVHIVNSMMYREITGSEPPNTPVTAQTYAQHNFPWYDLYDENMSEIKASSELSQVKTIKEMDIEKGFEPQQDDSSIDLSNSDKIKYPIKNPNQVTDGNW